MSRTVIAAIIYTLVILFIASAVVILSPTIHQQHQETSLDPEVAAINDGHIVQFLQTGESKYLLRINRITDAEVSHMFDVRRLLIWGAFITLGLSIVLIILWEKIEAKLAVFLSPFLISYLLIPSILMTNFDAMFLRFHEILFPQGNYSFPIDSALIVTYPPEFFSAMGLLIAKYFFFISLGFLVIKALSDILHTPIYRLKTRFLGR